MNRNLLIIHLKEKYGLKSLPIFYPDIYKDQVNFSYSDIASLYNRCVKETDVRAIELLIDTYNLEEIFKIANCGTEKSYSQEYTKTQKHNNDIRIYRHDKYNRNYHIGARQYRRWFKENKGQIILNSRAVVYQMKRTDIVKLFKLNNPNYTDDYSKTIIDLYEEFLRLPDKKELFIYYFKNLMNNKFPIMEIEMLENNEITVV